MNVITISTTISHGADKDSVMKHAEQLLLHAGTMTSDWHKVTGSREVRTVFPTEDQKMLAKAQATIGKTESGAKLQNHGEPSSISHLTTGQPDSGNHPYSKIDQLEDTGPGTGAESDVL